MLAHMKTAKEIRTKRPPFVHAWGHSQIRQRAPSADVAGVSSRKNHVPPKQQLQEHTCI